MDKPIEKKEIDTAEAVRTVCQIGERFERWGRVAEAAKEADRLRLARLNGLPMVRRPGMAFR